MEYHQILRFFFVRGLTTVILVGGMVVEGRQKICEFLTVVNMVSFCGFEYEGMSTDGNQDTENTETKVYTLHCTPLVFLRKYPSLTKGVPKCCGPG
jgi:hypothetical protein